MVNNCKVLIIYQTFNCSKLYNNRVLSEKIAQFDE